MVHLRPHLLRFAKISTYLHEIRTDVDIFMSLFRYICTTTCIFHMGYGMFMPDACFNNRDLTRASCMMIGVDTNILGFFWSDKPLELWWLYPWNSLTMCTQVFNVMYSYRVNTGPYQNIDHMQAVAGICLPLMIGLLTINAKRLFLRTKHDEDCRYRDIFIMDLMTLLMLRIIYQLL